jgi:hydrogenase expression/formation protein HypD
MSEATNPKIRDLRKAIQALADSIGRPLRLMEVCGTHTVAVFRHGIRSLLPGSIQLLSGPGCPVCVTSVKDVDRAVAISKAPGMVLATFGDMMRVPGGKGSLSDAKAEGASVRVVYSPLDALGMASKEGDMKVCFFAAGFETTIPLVAATLLEADRTGVGNFYIYSVHKVVPPALRALLEAPEVSVDGFILPGHVSTIIGSRPYEFLGKEYGVPSVITGFGAEDILEGILMLLEQVSSGRPEVRIQYRTVVRQEGNPRAMALIEEYFEPCASHWRGIGSIDGSGLRLRQKYSKRDVGGVCDLEVPDYPEPRGCSCGEVLRGVKAPTDCPLFGRRCTPASPVGACMVSTEGSCAAYYRYMGVGAG